MSRRLACVSLAVTALALGACSSSPNAPSDAGGIPIVLPIPVRDASKPVDAGHDTGRLDAGREAAADVTLVTEAGGEAGDGGAADVSGMDAPLLESGVPDGSVPYPAFGVDVPQVRSNGGPVVANGLFIPIVFAADPYAASLATFMSEVGASAYWTAVTSEYGVGPAKSAPLVTLTAQAPAMLKDSDIQAWLAQAIATDPRFLALPLAADAGLQSTPDPSAMPPAGAIYVIFYPTGTTITDTSGTSCEAFGAYHFNFALENGAQVVYAVVPRCAMFNGESGLDAVTSSTSHELIEASTDPEPYTSPGYVGVDEDHFLWELVLGNGEVGDMCSFVPDAQVRPTEPAFSGFLVQRTWSNKAAMALTDPCVPSIAGQAAYFNTVPVASQITFVDQGSTYPTLGTQIPVGQTATVTLDLFSSGPTGGPWKVYPLDYGEAFMNPKVLDLQIVGMSSGVNGQQVVLQITPLLPGTNALLGLSPYLLYSQQGNLSSFWVGTVSN